MVASSELPLIKARPSSFGCAAAFVFGAQPPPPPAAARRGAGENFCANVHSPLLATPAAAASLPAWLLPACLPGCIPYVRAH
jgi:hypothetical protein